MTNKERNMHICAQDAADEWDRTWAGNGPDGSLGRSGGPDTVSTSPEVIEAPQERIARITSENTRTGTPFAAGFKYERPL